MSSSSKKKLRKEQQTGLTSRQISEQKEAKQVKVLTSTFIVVMVLIVAIVVGVLVTPSIVAANNNKTLAVTVGGHDLNSTQLTYFYIDAINSYVQSVYQQLYGTYGNYWYLFLGFTPSTPLNQQKYNDEVGTWADYFTNVAIENATFVYAMTDKADAEKFTLSEKESASLKQKLEDVAKTASTNGYSSTNKYLSLMYCEGATLESYSAYYTLAATADAYYTAHADTLEYTDADYRAYEADKMTDYNSYSYALYQVKVSSYLTGGTKGEKDTITYSPEEKAAAEAAARKDVAALCAAGFKTVEDFNKAVKSLAINKGNTTVSVSEYNDYFLTSISNEEIKKWVSDSGRVVGDVKTFDIKTTTKDENGKTIETISGFYVVLYTGVNDNATALRTARHILVGFTGGTTNSSGNKVYSDQEKAAAKEKAEKLLADWRAGAATEDSFAALAKENSTDTGSKSEGGLYTNIYPGQMVKNFNDWVFDEERKPGDSGIVSSDYGYHVMYFVEVQDLTYRDLMIKSNLTSRDMEAWSKSVTEKVEVVKHDLSRLETDYKLG